MANLVVIAYDDEFRAAEVLATLRRLQRGHVIDLEDAVYVTKDGEGKIELNESTRLTSAGAASGGFWGLLIGALLVVPVAGTAMGAGAGSLAGRLTEIGLGSTFMKQLSGRLQPHSSALFLLVRSSTPERVLPEIAVFGGKVLQTSLAPDAEAELREALGTRDDWRIVTDADRRRPTRLRSVAYSKA